MTRKHKVEDYEMYIQDKPYPFGLLPKVKYELWSGKVCIYSFTTTIHGEEYCIDVLLDKVHLCWYGRIRMYKTIGGIRFKI